MMGSHGRSGRIAPGVLLDREDIPLFEGSSIWIKNGYAFFRQGDRKCISVARFLLGFPEGLDVDHINGNRLDNRRANLRAISHRLNAQLCGARRTSGTGLKGIYYRTGQRNPWHVEFGTAHVGVYGSRDEAISARIAAELEAYGEVSLCYRGYLPETR